MNFYDKLLLNIILLLFPIFIYLLYVAYSNNINKKKNKHIFDFLLLTSIYLLIKYKTYISSTAFILLINIPLLLSFFKKRYRCSIIISLIISIYYNIFYELNIYYVLLEYVFYFLYFYLLRNKNKKYDFFIYSFIFFKGIILSFEIFYILPTETSFYHLVLQIFIILVFFYIVINLSLYLLSMGEEILSLNQVLKELEKEKVLRNSLFKITHEIKNPLAVCKGYLDMMNYNNIDKVKTYNDIIAGEINRTLIIMDEFSDYTKVKVNLDEMDIIMLLEDTINSLNTLLESKNIKLEFNNNDDEEVYILGDYNKLKQVFINIIKNAIEAIKEQGIIKIHIKNYNKKVIIVFEDNGKGMNKEELTKINDMFYTTKENGTGLGIPLSNEIIKLHNGSIKFSSIEGKKTKVTIILHK